MRMRYLVVVGLSVLSALGLDTLLRLDVRRRSTLWSVLASAGLTVIAYWLVSQADWPVEAARIAFVRWQEVLMYVLLSATTFLLIVAIWSLKWRRQAVMGLLLLLIVDLGFANRAYLHTTSVSQYHDPGLAGAC
jgi:hypothetical protein